MDLKKNKTTMVVINHSLQHEHYIVLLNISVHICTHVKADLLNKCVKHTDICDNSQTDSVTFMTVSTVFT